MELLMNASSGDICYMQDIVTESEPIKEFLKKSTAITIFVASNIEKFI
jgi:hypothetical protein